MALRRRAQAGGGAELIILLNSLPKSPRRAGRRPVAALLVAAATAAALLVLPGCGGGTGCTSTSLKLFPVRAADQDDPVTLRARLTGDGKPVAGAKVVLRVSLKSSGGGSTRSDETVRTDADGIAKRHIEGGLASVGLSGDRITGYEAHFEPYNKVGGVDYCWAHTSG